MQGNRRTAQDALHAAVLVREHNPSVHLRLFSSNSHVIQMDAALHATPDGRLFKQS